MTTGNRGRRSGAVRCGADRGRGSAGKLLLLGLVMAWGLGIGCRPAPTGAGLPPPVVGVAEVVSSNVVLATEFIGQLDSPQTVEVRARVEAFVERVRFKEGVEVAAGDPLFDLDRRPFEEKLAAAEGTLAQARATLNRYEKDVARLEPLARQRAIPQQDLDNAVASVAVGRANIQSAEAAVKSAELDLGYCQVKAPAAGLIGARQVSVGSLVGKGEPTLLATISQLDPIWFYCSISEVDLLRAERKVRESGKRLGELPVKLVLADGSEFAEAGTWVFVDRAVDAATGTIRARAEFSNPEKLLRPGMFARARIALRPERPSIVVPQRAVQELQGTTFVWVIGADNTASQRTVKTGPRVGSDWVVEEGLVAGERIVVEGTQKVREGAPVQPMTLAQMAAAEGSAPKGAVGHAGRE